MNKRGQLAFGTSDFSNPTESYEVEKPNLIKRIIFGIISAIFLFTIAPVIVAINTSLSPLVCTNATACLFYKFIVPAVLLGGAIAIVKDMWGKA